MTEFALILPVLLLTVFVMIETARLLQAWLSVENGARFGIRYAVTGQYNPAYYNAGDCSVVCASTGFTCTSTSRVELENAARVLSTADDARAGSTGIMRNDSLNPATQWNKPGMFKVTVCPLGAGFTASNPSSFTGNWTAHCSPVDFAGSPGEPVSVVVDFNHPLILPLLSSYWPYLHLAARRDGIVEQFRVSRVIGSGAFSAPPTSTPKITDTPT